MSAIDPNSEHIYRRLRAGLARDEVAESVANTTNRRHRDRTLVTLRWLAGALVIMVVVGLAVVLAGCGSPAPVTTYPAPTTTLIVTTTPSAIPTATWTDADSAFLEDVVSNSDDVTVVSGEPNSWLLLTDGEAACLGLEMGQTPEQAADGLMGGTPWADDGLAVVNAANAYLCSQDGA